jgi:hypothetical protein
VTPVSSALDALHGGGMERLGRCLGAIYASIVDQPAALVVALLIATGALF